MELLMATNDLTKILENIKKAPESAKKYEDWFDILRSLDTAERGELIALRNSCAGAINRCTDTAEMKRIYEVIKKSYCYGAQHGSFHDFMIYIEWNRDPGKRFYQPRMKYLQPMVSGYQDIIDGKLDLLTVSQPKRTGKSQTELLAALYLSGMRPDNSSIMSGAGSELVQSFYKGMLEYLVPDNEYLFYDVFPKAKLVRTNADSMTINLCHNTRFPTITCRSLGGTFVGSTEATNLLIVDDPVATREDAMNRNILDKLWTTIRGDVFGRRIEGTPIIMTGTRYSLYDPIGRAQEEAGNVGWRWRAIEIPALDPVTDESNYMHIRDGKPVFTTEFFRNERKLLNDEQWMSEFQQQPFEAHGVVFPQEKLQRYFHLPVDKVPDTIMAVCDTKERGSDYVMMPIAYVYGDDVFIEDCVYDNGLPEFTKPECAKKLTDHRVSTCTFESNAAGEYYARDVEELMTQMGGRTAIRTKRTIANKEIRIQNSSDNVLKHFWFKDSSMYAVNSQYGQMIKAVISYTKDGKNPHDDAPDGLAMLEEQLRGVWVAKLSIFDRPF